MDTMESSHWRQVDSSAPVVPDARDVVVVVVAEFKAPKTSTMIR